jgi:transposase
MAMDQAAWHKANELVIPENVHISWQPPYSPQCNPVENIWDEIREKWSPNLVFKNMRAVEDTLEKALLTLENDNGRTQGLVISKILPLYGME